MVSPGWWKTLDLSVVSGKSVNSGFDENKSEFSVSVCSESLDMLSDVNSLLDKMVQIFWDGWGGTIDLQNSENFGTSDSLNLWNTEGISQDDTNLGWRGSSLGHLDHLLGKIISVDLNPAWWSLSVRKTSTGNTLSLGVHSTHCFFLIINNVYSPKKHPIII